MVSPALARYRRPDLPAYEEATHAFVEHVRRVPNGATLGDLVLAWSQVRGKIDDARNVAYIRYRQDTRHPKARAEDEFWNAAAGRLRELDVVYARALLESPFRESLDGRFGPQLLALKRCDVAAFAPAIAGSINEEAELVSRYTAILARADLRWRGEPLNLSQIARWFPDGDRATRLEAQRAREAFFAAHGAEIDEIYDRLVALRHGMGQALGHATYTPLGYQLMSRTSYGPADVARFRDEVLREVVPFAAERMAVRARRLGLAALEFHDEPVAFLDGNPRPLGDASFCMAEAQGMFDALDPGAGAFFRRLVEHQLLDLESRDGKAGGGFCTNLAETGEPFIFANFNGSDADVKVFTHECGHAFQVWESRDLPLLEYRSATAEAAEVHSMGMEALCHPHLERFFGDGAARYRHLHLEQSLVNMAYQAAVDHFQEEVYAHPAWSAAERRTTWRAMERRYLPYRDYAGRFPTFEAGGQWQRQHHIVGHPFYYIDYALAQTCALQLWLRALDDRPAAWRDYLVMCRLGGSRPFAQMIAAGGLRSPFEPGCLRDVVARVRTVLDGD